MNATELISQPIINLYSGNYEGTIKDICFDNRYKRVKWLIYFEESGDMEDKALDASKIHHIGPNAITIKNGDGIYPLVSIEGDLVRNNILGHSVYNTDGEFIGRVQEIVLNNNMSVGSVLLENSTLDTNKIISSRDHTIIINTGKKLNLKRSKHRHMEKLAKQNQKVIIQQVSPPTIQQPKSNTITFSPNENIRTITNTSTLLGRTITQNIYGSNNEIIAKKNTKITARHIEWASQNNKLSELTIYSTR